jgi:hypothetical protein
LENNDDDEQLKNELKELENLSLDGEEEMAQ